MAEYQFEYLKILSEEGIDAKDLPTEIKNKLKAVPIQNAKYKKDESPENLASLEKLDLSITDAIETYLEQKAESEKKAADEKAEADRVAAEKKAADEKAESEKKAADEKAEADRAAAEKAEQERQEAEKQPENQVRAKLVNNEISAKDLKAILGSLNWSGVEKVGSIKLQKVYLKEAYRVA